VVEQQGRSWFARRHTVAVALTTASLALTGCAAGQIAQTVSQNSVVDGITADIGTMGIRDAGFSTPADGKSWPAGSTVPLQLVLVNNGQSDDTLTGVTSSVAAGPAIVSGGAVNYPTNPADNVDTTPLVIKAGRSVNVGMNVADAVIAFRSTSTALFPSQSVPVTFTFASGKTLNTTLAVKLSGGAQPGPTLPVSSSNGE